MVTCHFLEMFLTSEESGTTGECNFGMIEEKFEDYGISWKNCVRLSVDNSNVIIYETNSVASRFKEKNENYSIGRCVCHLVHIAASNGNDAIIEHITINVEEVMVDLLYRLNKSSKKTGKLKEYFKFCNQEYLNVLKHLFVRWLSLKKFVSRTVHHTS